MAKLFGKEMTRREIMRRVGDISQIARITDYRFQSGRAEGMRGYEVVTGSGLAFTVLPSRCMDIAFASYKNTPIAHISKVGLSAPSFFEEEENGFLRNFTCGLLTTCGLTYMGAAGTDQGEKLGLHGRIANIPAANCSAVTEWAGDDLMFTIRGQMRESRVFGENMVLNREITTKMGSNEIHIRDTIVNEGFEETPLMLLYHCNFGYPLIDENTRLFIGSDRAKARDDRAQEGIDSWNSFHEPERGFAEQVYYLDPATDGEGYSEAVLENPDLAGGGMRLRLRFRRDTLPYCIEWKQLGEGDYVVGIEPGTWLPEGRAKARERNELKLLDPGEEYSTELSIIVEDNTKNR